MAKDKKAAAVSRKNGAAAPAVAAADHTASEAVLAQVGDLMFDDEDDISASLTRALSELGDEAGQARITVLRKPVDARSKPAYVNSWYASEFSLDQLAAGFGGGNYMYRVMGADGKFITRGVVSIEEPRNPAAVHGAAPPVAAGAAPTSGAAEIAGAILEALKPILERPQRSTQDVLAEMKLMREVLFPAGGAVVTPENKSVIDQVQDALKLQKMLRDMVPSAPRGGAGDSGFTVIGKLIEQFAPIFTAKLQEAQALQAAGGGAAVPALPDAAEVVPPADGAASVAVVGAGGGAAPNVEKIVTPGAGADLNIMIKVALADLANQARENKDANLYAELVYDRVTDAKVIQDLCTRADWWEHLCNLNNDIRPYSAWFAQLREGLVKIAISENLIPDPAAAAV